jgi:hypothetical protein
MLKSLCFQVLHPFASLVGVNDAIWKMYFDEWLPLFTVDGDDSSYAETVALDFACLQVCVAYSFSLVFSFSSAQGN